MYMYICMVVMVPRQMVRNIGALLLKIISKLVVKWLSAAAEKLPDWLIYYIGQPFLSIRLFIFPDFFAEVCPHNAAKPDSHWESGFRSG